MSLVGMMIKNAVVLLDPVNILLAQDQKRYGAIVTAAISRARPAGRSSRWDHTELGIIPLLQDVFWVGLAVTVMAGRLNAKAFKSSLYTTEDQTALQTFDNTTETLTFKFAVQATAL